ncbi:MAG: FAD-dependent oxidoreductase [Acidobacteria bacterium]|nr:FAD-dependent oxidoreductase [Acidobacteriota bacterium]
MKRKKETKKNLSRRDFIKTTAVGVGATALAGLGAKEAKAIPITEVPRWDREADVVIVGCGASGSVAAIEAYDAGAEVLMLEKTPNFGGAGTLSGGAVYGCATFLQRRAGIEDSPDEMFKYVMAIGGGVSDPNMLRVWCENCGALVDWLASLGVQFTGPNYSGEELLYANIAKPAPRGHSTVGRGQALLQVLESQVDLRGIEYLTETPASELIVRSGAATEVVGVRSKTKGLYIKARTGVVLAAGGYATDAAALKKYTMFSLPLLVNPMMKGFTADDGDGIAMAQDVGCDFYGIDTMAPRVLVLVGYPTPGYAYYVGFSVGGVIWVNEAGQRFMDEKTFYGKAPFVLKTQTNAHAFQIFDQAAIAGGGAKVGPFSNDLSKELAIGSIKTAATIRALASVIGVNADNLDATVSTWNTNAAQGKDPQFGRTLVAPINTPPFYAADVRNYAGYNYGGVRITPDCRVVKALGSVIHRLYAAGSTTGGVLGQVHPGAGTMISKAMTFGRIAGQNAALEAPWS